MKSISKILSLLLVTGLIVFLTGCSDDDPVKEDIPELITKATLTFTPATGSAVVVTATDPDGEGVQSIKVDGPITLVKGMKYTLTIQLLNELAKPTDAEYNVTDEVEEEGVEHQFYFSWTEGAFSSPSGNGNIDNRADAINYKDTDKNNLPIGLTTEWMATSSTITAGNFRTVLKHQPELKSATSTFNDGETDLDITFTLNVN
ncbi:MAG: hypothetical protein DI538_02830 [Azospira oryzae]|jgi:hypothetical protein|nr:MAG: hypothetical protein DI538_02830 [Azospira oryzae]